MNAENDGGVPQTPPAKICPAGHAHALPLQVWPPVQMLTQLDPFQEVPAAQVTQLEPLQLEPTGHAQAEPFQAWPPVQMLAQLELFQAVPPPQGVWQVPKALSHEVPAAHWQDSAPVLKNWLPGQAGMGLQS